MRLRLRRFFRWLGTRLWLRPAIYSFAAVGIVFLASIADTFLSQIGILDVTEDIIKNLLTIIASSMLAVATFSVQVMLSSYTSALSSSTPRAFDAVVSDNSTRQAISSFIGAFIFAMIGLMAVNFGYFGGPGRTILFIMTLGVFAWVVGTFVYWIDHVTRVGQLRYTIGRVADQAQTILANYMSDTRPSLESVPSDTEPNPKAIALYSDVVGIVNTFSPGDMITLLGDDSDEVEVLVVARPGAKAGPEHPLLYISGMEVDDDLKASLRACFDIGTERTFEEDPEMALRILGEIADRALSPGVNDPGTALDVLNSLQRVFTHAVRDADELRKARADSGSEPDQRIKVRRISPERLLGVAFEPIARDGAGAVEVAEALQLTLTSIRPVLPDDYGTALRVISQRSLDYAEKELPFEWEKKRVRHATRRLAMEGKQK